MAPSDVSNLLKVEITLGSSNGKDAAVTMQKLTLNRDSNWDAVQRQVQRQVQTPQVQVHTAQVQVQVGTPQVQVQVEAYRLSPRSGW